LASRGWRFSSCTPDARLYLRVRSNDDLTKRFDELDKDGNGVLSENEVVTVIGEMMGVDRPRAIALMQMFDRNQDGNLDKTEFMQLWASMFGGR